LQIGYTALRDFRSPLTSSPFPLVDILDGSGNPYTSFGYEQFTYGNLLNTDVYQLNDIYTMYKGAHEITIGTQNSLKKISKTDFLLLMKAFTVSAVWVRLCSCRQSWSKSASIRSVLYAATNGPSPGRTTGS